MPPPTTRPAPTSRSAETESPYNIIHETPPPEKAKTERLGLNMDQIPFEALDAIGKIFAEGEIKYGRDNWKKGINDTEYQRERLNHAIRHLMLYANGDKSEPHLAKVAWFCVTQLHFESFCVDYTPKILQPNETYETQR